MIRNLGDPREDRGDGLHDDALFVVRRDQYGHVGEGRASRHGPPQLLDQSEQADDRSAPAPQHNSGMKMVPMKTNHWYVKK